MEDSIQKIESYIRENIDDFHNQRNDCLKRLKLEKVIKRKNPYLFKAKNMTRAQDIVKSFLDAHISSNEETIFGAFLEGLALFVCQEFRNGWKSSAAGIDLEFDYENIRYIISIKSGPNWGNSRQIAKLKNDFITAIKTLRTSNSRLNIMAINGCCYGREKNPDKGIYKKYCGQMFWTFISGDDSLYLKLIKPLEYKAKERNAEFLTNYDRTLNLFTLEFSSKYCNQDGSINWNKIVNLNSSIIEPKLKK